ncbi:MAG: hypothetical protein MK101_11990, partial [Phycisphaerales bacterium]|nr:hypothetical protein [Phycisphaerales bacterium]
LYTTAVLPGSGGQGVGHVSANVPLNAPNGSAYAWDLQADIDGELAPWTVGRFPQLNQLALELVLLDPPGDDEVVTDPPALAARFDVLVGTLISGEVAYIRAADDDLEIEVQSETYTEGPIKTEIWVPGPAFHLGFGESQEVMITFDTSGLFDFAEVFSVDVQRSGPNRPGSIVPYVFNFNMNQWEQLYTTSFVNSDDVNPAIDQYTPTAGSDPRFYLNPDPDRENQIYIRLGVVCAGSPHEIHWDYVSLNGLDIPDNGGGAGP